MNVQLNVTENSRVIKLVLSSSGVRGAPGPAGTSAILEVTDSVANAAALPDADEHENEFWVAEDTGVIWYSNGTIWIEAAISSGGGGTGDVSDGGTLATGLTFPLAGLHILDTNGSHDLILSPGSNLTADRTLTLTTGDENRTLTIGASASVAGSNTGDQDLTGYVTKATYDANSILAATTDNTPAAVTVAEQTLVGRITSGAIDDLSATQVRTLLNVADGATAAGSTGDAFASSHPGGNQHIDWTSDQGATNIHSGNIPALPYDPAGSAAAVSVASIGAAAASHAHGNITSAGAIGSTASLPIITTTSGVLTAGAFGTGATNFCAGNDARLSDARTPVAHNQAETTITFTNVATGNASTTAHGFAPIATAPDAAQLNVLGIAVGETVYTNKAVFDALTPADLGVSAAGSSIIAAHRDHVHKMPSAADVGAATTATKLDAFGTPDDNTALNASSTRHGLLLKLENTGTKYLRDDGSWQAVAGGDATQAFGTIVVAGQSNVVADAAPDSLTLVAGTMISLTTDAGADSVTITGTGAAAAHAHGNITTAGAIGSTASLPIITTTDGALTVGAFGTGATNFCAGNDARLSDARTPVAHNQAETTITFTDVATGNASTTAHGFSPKATAPAAGLVNVLAIANGETAHSDKALFDTTNPAALGSVGPGTAVIAARRDHVHAMPSAANVGAAAAASFIAGAGALTGPAAPLTIGTAAGAATGDFAAASHAHGNVTSAGAIGSTANLPVITTTSGALTVGAFGTGATNFTAGNDARLSDARTPVAHNQAETTITFSDVATGDASTTAHGFAPKAVAPAAGLLNVLGIANGETAYSMKGAEPAANITTAARTVLDDATVADMVNTLGGATSTGTGGLARATSPTFVTPILGTPTSGTLTNCTGYPAATTSAAGLLHAVTAPASGSLNVSGIANGETVHTEKTIFVGCLQISVVDELPAEPVATTVYLVY